VEKETIERNGKCIYDMFKANFKRDNFPIVDIFSQDLSCDVTMIIPTYGDNRHYMYQVYHYYKHLKCKIIICDQSPTRQNYISEFDTSDHFHYINVNKKFADAVSEALNLVTTPFVCFWTQDDFLYYEALSDGVAFLKTNSEYGSYIGRMRQYIYEEDRFIDYSEKIFEKRELKSTPKKAIKDFFLNPYVCCWGIYRTDLLKKVFQLISKIEKFENQFFYEYMFNTIILSSSGVHIDAKKWFAIKELTQGECWRNQSPHPWSVKNSQAIKSDIANIKVIVDQEFGQGITDCMVKYYFYNMTLKGKIVRRIKKLFKI